MKMNSHVEVDADETELSTEHKAEQNQRASRLEDRKRDKRRFNDFEDDDFWS